MDDETTLDLTSNNGEEVDVTTNDHDEGEEAEKKAAEEAEKKENEVIDNESNGLLCSLATVTFVLHHWSLNRLSRHRVKYIFESTFLYTKL